MCDLAQSLLIAAPLPPPNSISSLEIHHFVDRFAASGFDITMPLKEFNNGTCLHLVSNFGSLTMTYLILSRATSTTFINRLDKAMRTATMCSVVGGKNDILKLLIQCGADMTIKVS